jgi:hypothetical protein
VRLISSRLTVFTKRALPAVMFAGLAVSLVLQAVRQGFHVEFFVAAAVFGIIAYIILRKSRLRDLADEVWDAGTELVIKNRGTQEHVPLSEIMNISYSSFNPQRATLYLRQPGVFGKEIHFIPPNQFLPWAKNPAVDELIERVDAARRR